MKIDLVEEGPEATRLAAALVGAGFELALREVSELLAEGSSAKLLIVAGDGLGVLDFLRRRTKRGGLAQPTFVVGSPDGLPIAGGMARDVGCTRYFPRPLSVPRLVERAEELREKVGGDLVPLVGAREPTIRLREDESFSSAGVVVESSSTGEHSAEVTGLRVSGRASGDTGSGVIIDTGAEVEPAISVRLFEVLRKADRRLFPDQQPVSLLFAAGQESARDMVSPIVLEDVSLPLEPDEDRFAGFTILGSSSEVSDTPASEIIALPPGPRAGSSGPIHDHTVTEVPGGRAPAERRAAPESRREVSHREERSRPGEVQSSPTIDALELGEPSADGLGRRGEVADAGVLRLLWIIVRRKLDVRVNLDLGEGMRLSLTIRRGRLTRMAGPVAMSVMDDLRRDGLVQVTPSDEVQAQRMLELKLRDGQLSRFEYHRRRANSRHHVLHNAVASRGGTFLIRPLSELEAGEPIWATLVKGGLAAVLVEGARRRLDVGRVRRLLSDQQGVMALGPEAPARFIEAVVEPEIVALLMDHEGTTLDALLTAGPPDSGIAGLVFALVGIGALSFRDGSPRELSGAVEPAVVRSTIRRMNDLIAESDYFRILNLSADASFREVRAAYESRLGHLQSLVVGPGSDLQLQKDEIRFAFDEALRVLRDPGLREAYRQALFPGTRDGVEAPTSPGFFPQ